MLRITVRIPEPYGEKLVAEADQEVRSLNEQIVFLIKGWYDRKWMMT